MTELNAVCPALVIEVRRLRIVSLKHRARPVQQLVMPHLIGVVRRSGRYNSVAVSSKRS